MDPEDYLKTAEFLKGANAESDHRSSISRSYYAVYQMVRIAFLNLIPLACLQAAGLGSKGHIAHDKLAVRLSTSPDPRIKRFGETLAGLKDARHLADYYFDRPVSKRKAEVEFDTADDLRVDLKAFGMDRLALTIKAELEREQQGIS